MPVRDALRRLTERASAAFDDSIVARLPAPAAEPVEEACAERAGRVLDSPSSSRVTQAGPR